MIAHIVLFSPKATIGEADRRALTDAIAEAGRSIPSIRRAYVGRSADIDAGYARSMGDEGYPYAAVVECDSTADLLAYLQHPAHARLGRLFWDLCDRSVVVEIETRDFNAPDLAEFLLD